MQGVANHRNLDSKVVVLHHFDSQICQSRVTNGAGDSLAIAIG
jgi:hypothetical protein